MPPYQAINQAAGLIIPEIILLATVCVMFLAGPFLVSESGIKNPADVQRVRACGVHAVLVGESLMRQPDLESAVRALMGA